MTSSKRKRKRSRAVIVALLPALVFLWIVGWCLYWIGHQRESRKPPRSPSPQEEEHVSLIPAVLEDAVEIEN